MKKLSATMLSMVLAGTLLLAGCGGNPSNGSATDNQPPEDASQSDATNGSDTNSGADNANADSLSTGATPTLDAIKERGEIIMLTNAQFPPFEYQGDDGSIMGVDPDIAQSIADALGVELNIVDMDFDGIVDALKAGKGDFAAAGMTVTEERLQQVDFTNEYVTSSQMVVIPAGSELTADDSVLSGKNIAVQEGTTGDWYASGDETTGSTIQDANVLRFKSGVEAGMMLAQGKADAMIIDQKPAEAIVQAQDSTLELLPEKLTDEHYAFAVQKDQQDLVDFINGVLKDNYSDGKVDELITKHMGME